MSDVLAAAFLILLDSQAPCPGDSIAIDSNPPPIQTIFGYPYEVIAVKDRAALDSAFKTAWLGPACHWGPTVEVSVLDVRAGKWLTFVQRKVMRKREIQEVDGFAAELKP